MSTDVVERTLSCALVTVNIAVNLVKTNDALNSDSIVFRAAFYFDVTFWGNDIIKYFRIMY